jgi:hypothetical protein
MASAVQLQAEYPFKEPTMKHAVAMVLVAAAVATGCKGDAAKPAAKEPKPVVDPPIAMVVLVEGQPYWLYSDPATKAPELKPGVESALAVLAAAGPEHSTAAVLSYSGEVKAGPFADVRTLKGSSLPDDPKAEPATELFKGLAEARTQLAAQPATRKVLVVIGDGTNVVVNANIAPEVEALRAAGIETYSIVARSTLLDGFSPENGRAMGINGYCQARSNNDMGYCARRMLEKINATAAAAKPAAPATAATKSPIAMVVLVEGHKYWLYADPDTKAPRFKPAVEKVLGVLAAAGPDHSTASVISYTEGAIATPFNDVRQLDHATLPEDAAEMPMRDLYNALFEARTQLLAQPTSRKVLVVIGDGIDTNNEAPIAPEVEALRASGIETYSIYLASDALEPNSSTNAKDLGISSFCPVSGWDSSDGRLLECARSILAKINS